MYEKIKNTLSSREFQTAVAKTGGMVVTLVVTSLVSGLVNKGIDAGIDALMDKIHGTETPAE